MQKSIGKVNFKLKKYRKNSNSPLLNSGEFVLNQYSVFQFQVLCQVF